MNTDAAVWASEFARDHCVSGTESHPKYFSINITDLNSYGNAAGTSVDWNFHAVPQTYAAGQNTPITRGKILG